MTNERAIELLRRLQDEQFDGIHGDERRQALDMAIMALEPNLGENGSITCMKAEKTHDRTTGDSINRQQAIEAVRKAKFSFRIESDIYFKICSGAMDEILNKIIDAHVKALEDLPPAEHARFWIDSEGKISALPSGQIATDTNVGDKISRKGVFIPDITVEMFRNASLEGVEDLLASGEMEDISLPPEQPQRKKGRWKLLVNGDAICSECGRKQKCVWDFDNWDNFCRHCGSDMRGESE